MTVKHRANGEPTLKLGAVDITYRNIVIMLLLSLTPLGKPVWRMAGWVDSGDSTANNTTVATLDQINRRMAAIEVQVNKLSATVDSVSSFVEGMKHPQHL